ncbi:PQQ-binding-like beta-propeller repeat protein [Chloroflexota bacterium]
MRTRHKKVTTLLLLLMLTVLLSGLFFTGCLGGGFGAPRGWSGGVMDGDILYIGSMDGRLVAVNTTDGSVLWAVPLESQTTSSSSLSCAPVSKAIAIYGAPAVAEDLVYIAGYSGWVYAFSRDGTRQEPRWVGPRQESDRGTIIGGVIYDQGRLYFGASNQKVYALDAAEGYTEWKYDEIGDKIWSTPTVDGDTLYIGSFDKKLYTLNTDTGEKEWDYEAGGAIVAPPLVYNSMVYFGSFDRYFYAVDTGGNYKWKFSGENWFWAKAIARNGTIYAGCLDGKVYALNADSGSLQKEFDLEGPISSSPVLVDDLLIVVTEEGVVYALDTGSNQKRELVNLEEKVNAALTAGQGVVYVHTVADTLHEVDVHSGAKRDIVIKEPEEEKE